MTSCFASWCVFSHVFLWCLLRCTDGTQELLRLSATIEEIFSSFFVIFVLFCFSLCFVHYVSPNLVFSPGRLVLFWSMFYTSYLFWVLLFFLFLRFLSTISWRVCGHFIIATSSHGFWELIYAGFLRRRASMDKTGGGRGGEDCTMFVKTQKNSTQLRSFGPEIFSSMKEPSEKYRGKLKRPEFCVFHPDFSDFILSS